MYMTRKFFIIHLRSIRIIQSWLRTNYTRNKITNDDDDDSSYTSYYTPTYSDIDEDYFSTINHRINEDYNKHRKAIKIQTRIYVIKLSF